MSDSRHLISGYNQSLNWFLGDESKKVSGPRFEDPHERYSPTQRPYSPTVPSGRYSPTQPSLQQEYDPERPYYDPSPVKGYDPCDPPLGYSYADRTQVQRSYKGYEGQPGGQVRRRGKYNRRRHIPPSDPNSRFSFTKPHKHKKRNRHKKVFQSPVMQQPPPSQRSRYNILGFEQRQYHIISKHEIPELVVHHRGESAFDEYKGVCWWCLHSWDGKFVGCPYYAKGKMYKLEGFFCSWNCALAYGMDQKRSGKMSSNASVKTYIRVLRRKELGKNATMEQVMIEEAPDFHVLKMFGGPLSIEEFRKMSGGNVRIKTYPERLNIMPYGMVCYFEDLDRPMKKFDSLKVAPVKIDGRGRRVIRAKEKNTIPEFEIERKITVEEKEALDAEPKIKLRASVIHAQSRRETAKLLQKNKGGGREKKKRKTVSFKNITELMTPPDGKEEPKKKKRKTTKPPKPPKKRGTKFKTMDMFLEKE